MKSRGVGEHLFVVALPAFVLPGAVAAAQPAVVVPSVPQLFRVSCFVFFGNIYINIYI